MSKLLCKWQKKLFMPRRGILTLHLQIVWRSLINGNSYFFLGYARYHAFKVLLVVFFYRINLFSFLFLTLQPIRLSDLQKVDPQKACEYFNRVLCVVRCALVREWKLNRLISYSLDIPSTIIAGFEVIRIHFTRRETNDCHVLMPSISSLTCSKEDVSSNPFLTWSKEDKIAIRLFAISTIISSAAKK